MRVNESRPGSRRSTCESLLRGLIGLNRGEGEPPLKPAPEKSDFVSTTKTTSETQIMRNPVLPTCNSAIVVSGVIGLTPPLLPPTLKAPITLMLGRAQRRLVVVVAVVLKADLITALVPRTCESWILHRMFGGVGIVARGRQREPSDAGIILGWSSENW